MKTNIHVLSYLAQLFLEWEMLQTKIVEKFKTNILCLIIFFFFFENRAVNLEKYCRVGQATDANMAHARCMMDT